MSGIAYHNNSFWVATYYPDPGMIYKINQDGEVLHQIPATICQLAGIRDRIFYVYS